MKKKILVVDDTGSIREALEKVLRAEGYDVFLAADGREGVEKFNNEIMDLAVLDVNLPDMTGWEVFETITRINPFVPVVIITGEGTHRRFATLGSGALLEKPLNVPRLLARVAELLGDAPVAHIRPLAVLGGDLRHAETGAEGGW